MCNHRIGGLERYTVFRLSLIHILRTTAENGQSESVVPDSENHVFSEINVNLEHLYSPYAILIELDSGKVLAEHNSEDKIYPASLTKIMTAVLAIENTDDMSQTVTLPY